MPEYLAPGVYIEEISTGPVPIEGVSTSTTGMVGPTPRGPLRPRLVTSWLEFQLWYGGLTELGPRRPSPPRPRGSPTPSGRRRGSSTTAASGCSWPGSSGTSPESDAESGPAPPSPPRSTSAGPTTLTIQSVGPGALDEPDLRPGRARRCGIRQSDRPDPTRGSGSASRSTTSLRPSPVGRPAVARPARPAQSQPARARPSWRTTTTSRPATSRSRCSGSTLITAAFAAGPACPARPCRFHRRSPAGNYGLPAGTTELHR